MRINWRAAKSSKQPGQRVCCVPDRGGGVGLGGTAFWFPPLLCGAIQLRCQRALKENTGPLQILHQRAFSEQHRCVWKGNVLSMRGWIKAKRRPLLCWHSWWMQQPSAEAIYIGEMKLSIHTRCYAITCFTRRQRTVGDANPNITSNTDEGKWLHRRTRWNLSLWSPYPFPFVVFSRVGLYSSLRDTTAVLCGNQP